MNRVTLHTDYFDPYSAREERQVPVGRSLAEIVRDLEIDISAPFVCFVQGQPILRKPTTDDWYGEWEHFFPTDTDLTQFMWVPRGGGGGGKKNPLATILLLALVVAVTYFTAGSGAASAGSLLSLGGSLASTYPVAAALVSAALIAGGSMLINAVLPPSMPKAEDVAPSPSYSAYLRGNQARLTQPKEVQCGRVLAHPSFAQSPFQRFSASSAQESGETTVGDQTFYALYYLAEGSFDVEKYTVLNQDVANYADQIKIRKYEPGEPVTDFPLNVVVVEEVSNVELTPKNARIDWTTADEHGKPIEDSGPDGYDDRYPSEGDGHLVATMDKYLYEGLVEAVDGTDGTHGLHSDDPFGYQYATLKLGPKVEEGTLNAPFPLCDPVDGFVKDSLVGLHLLIGFPFGTGKLANVNPVFWYSIVANEGFYVTYYVERHSAQDWVDTSYPEDYASVYPAVGSMAAVVQINNWEGPFTINRDSSSNAIDRIEYDIVAPAGIYYQSSGGRQTLAIDLRAEFREIEETTGLPTTGIWYPFEAEHARGTLFGFRNKWELGWSRALELNNELWKADGNPTGGYTHRMEYNRAAPVRETRRSRRLTAGRYEMRLRRSSYQYNRGGEQNYAQQVVWAGLRGFGVAGTTKNVWTDGTILSVEIHGSSSVNNNSMKEFGVLCTAKKRDYIGPVDPEDFTPLGVNPLSALVEDDVSIIGGRYLSRISKAGIGSRFLRGGKVTTSGFTNAVVVELGVEKNNNGTFTIYAIEDDALVINAGMTTEASGLGKVAARHRIDITVTEELRNAVLDGARLQLIGADAFAGLTAEDLNPSTFITDATDPDYGVGTTLAGREVTITGEFTLSMEMPNPPTSTNGGGGGGITYEIREWTDIHPTRTISSALIDIHHNPKYGAGLPYSRIDLAGLRALEVTWSNRDNHRLVDADDIDSGIEWNPKPVRDRFDYRFETRDDLNATFQMIARAGRGRAIFPNGKLFVNRDEPRALADAAFSPRNITKDSLSIGYAFKNGDSADHLILEYVDEDLWDTNEQIISPKVQFVSQTLTDTGAADGKFTLSYRGQTTEELNWDATAEEVQAELESMVTVVDEDTLVCTGGPLPGEPIVITHSGALAGTNVPPITAASSLSEPLTGTGVAEITVTTEGVLDTTDEIQSLEVSGFINGVFQLEYVGQTSDVIGHDASAAAVQAALRAMSNIDAGDVICTGGPLGTAPVAIHFTGGLGERDVETIITHDGDLVAVDLGVNYDRNPEYPGIRPLRIRQVGIVQRKHSWREGAVEFGSTRYRRRFVTWETDIEGLIPRHMSRVDFNSEIGDWGQYGHIVDYVEGGDGESDSLFTSVPVRWEGIVGAGTHVMQLRDLHGVPSEAGLFFVIPGTQINELLVVDSEGEPAGLDTFEIGLHTDDHVGREATFYSFGPLGHHKLDLMITGILPTARNKVTLQATTYREAGIYDADDDLANHAYLPPDEAQRLTQDPVAPDITGLGAGLSGTRADPIAHVSWDIAAGAKEYYVEISYDDGLTWLKVLRTAQTSVSISLNAPIRTEIPQIFIDVTGEVRGAWDTRLQQIVESEEELWFADQWTGGYEFRFLSGPYDQKMYKIKFSGSDNTDTNTLKVHQPLPLLNDLGETVEGVIVQIIKHDVLIGVRAINRLVGNRATCVLTYDQFGKLGTPISVSEDGTVSVLRGSGVSEENPHIGDDAYTPVTLWRTDEEGNIFARGGFYSDLTSANEYSVYIGLAVAGSATTYTLPVAPRGGTAIFVYDGDDRLLTTGYTVTDTVLELDAAPTGTVRVMMIGAGATTALDTVHLSTPLTFVDGEDTAELPFTPYNAEELLVYLNERALYLTDGVPEETKYSLSGLTMTFGRALVAGDDEIVVAGVQDGAGEFSRKFRIVRFATDVLPVSRMFADRSMIVVGEDTRWGDTDFSVVDQAILWTPVAPAPTADKYLVTLSDAPSTPTWAIPIVGSGTGFVTQQFTDVFTVTVTHNFGAFPIVQVIDASRKRFVPYNIEDNNVNEFTVTFREATSGWIVATTGGEVLSRAVRTVTTAFEITADDFTVKCVGDLAGEIASGLGVEGQVYNLKNGAGTVTLTVTGGGTIDGKTTFTLRLPNANVTLQRSGDDFLVL